MLLKKPIFYTSLLTIFISLIIVRFPEIIPDCITQLNFYKYIDGLNDNLILNGVNLPHTIILFSVIIGFVSILLNLFTEKYKYRDIEVREVKIRGISLILLIIGIILNFIIFNILEIKGLIGPDVGSTEDNFDNLLIFLLWEIIIGGIGCYLYREDRRKGINYRIGLKKEEIIGLFVFGGILLVYYCYYLNSWKFSIIGDDYSFLWTAQDLSKKGLRKIEWFESNGIYGDIPVFMTGIQALCITIFGSYFGNNVGWRMSSVLLTISCLFPLYLIFRVILKSRSRDYIMSSFVGCGFFFFSEQISTWARIGKPCNIGIVTIAWSIMLLIAGLRKRSCFLLYLSGVICGFGLYLNILGPSITIPVLFVILLYNFSKVFRQDRKLSLKIFTPSIIVISGFLLIGMANLIQYDYIIHQYGKHLMKSTEDKPDGLFFIFRMIYGLFLMINFKGLGSFMVDNVVDIITVTFAILGLISIRRLGLFTWSGYFLGYLFIIFITCGISPYMPPSLTRTMYLMYPIALYGMLGFDWLISYVKDKKDKIRLTILVIFLVFIYNLIKTVEYNPYHFQREYEIHFLQFMENEDKDKNYIFILQEDKSPFIGEALLDNYNYKDRVLFVQENEEGFKKICEFNKPASIIMVNECKNIGEIRKCSNKLSYKIEGCIPWFDLPTMKYENEFWRRLMVVEHLL